MLTIKGLKFSLVAGAAILVFAAGQAMADSGSATETYNADCRDLQNRVDKEKSDSVQSYIPKEDPAKAIKRSSCLDGILNSKINIGVFFSIPNILDMVEGMVCNAANQAIGSAVGSINQRIGQSVSVPYFGTVGGVSAGSTTSSGGPIIQTTGTVNGQTVNNQNAAAVFQQTPGTIQQSANNSVQNAQGTLSGVWDKVKSFWK